MVSGLSPGEREEGYRGHSSILALQRCFFVVETVCLRGLSVCVWGCGVVGLWASGKTLSLLRKISLWPWIQYNYTPKAYMVCLLTISHIRQA